MQAGGLIWSSRSSNKVGLKFWRVRPSFVRKASKEVIFFPGRKEEKRKLLLQRWNCFSKDDLLLPALSRNLSLERRELGDLNLCQDGKNMTGEGSIPPSNLPPVRACAHTHAPNLAGRPSHTQAHASAFLSQCLCDTCEICFCRNKLFILLNFYYFSIAAFTWVGFSLSHFISLDSHQHTHNKTH